MAKSKTRGHLHAGSYLRNWGKSEAAIIAARILEERAEQGRQKKAEKKAEKEALLLPRRYVSPESREKP